ncbi:hypothetical protein M011DRAFT_262001 [Sporormia fimetaria CBS 119925]|uniref:Uncharacterized protein n=1 Tax=Sporormia fimetaria CBS 119925 TaxID=1340428 RepID=A0A6A6UYX2_9PLEO|nr:hypothetical protein M011DRAFT_262001 [Sporormia fimetaria CBS 119925]
MDIHKWLEDTILPQQPASDSPPHKHGSTSHFPVHDARAEPKQRHRRRREKSTSDSSLLRVRTTRNQSPPPIKANAEAVDRGRDRSARDVRQSSSSESSYTYARKPRHKTNPERYEAFKAAKASGKQPGRHGKRESGKTKRASKRKKKEKSGGAVIPHFEAKNVAKNRLTLKPRRELGLFNRGRVSSPVKGRVPDLVFSEMKFLQKQRDQPEVNSKPGPTKKKRKVHQAQAREEEISAYFTSVRPALADSSLNVQAREAIRRPKSPDSWVEKASRPSLVKSATSVVGGQQPSLAYARSRPGHGSNSPISWSDSVRAHSVVPAQVPVASLSNRQLSTTQTGTEGADSAQHGNQLHSRRLPDSSRNQLYGSSRHSGVSSRVPETERFPRSSSYPHSPSSPWPFRENSLPHRHQKSKTTGVHSPLPTVEGQIQPPLGKTCGGDGDRRHHYPSAPAFKMTDRRGCVPDGGDQETSGDANSNEPSSTLGKLLHECNAAFDAQRRQSDVSELHEVDADPTRGRAALHHDEAYSRSEETHDNGFRLPAVGFSMADTCQPLTTEYAGRGIYEEQERRERDAHRSEPCADRLQAQFISNFDREDVWQPDQEAVEVEETEEMEHAEDEAVLDDEAGLGVGAAWNEGIGAMSTIWQPVEDTRRPFWRPNRLY